MKKCRVYLGFRYMEKAYRGINMEALCQVLRMYDEGGKLMILIKSMDINRLRENKRG